MDDLKVPSWVYAAVALLIYIGLGYLFRVDLKLALLILIAYHVLKCSRDESDV